MNVVVLVPRRADGGRRDQVWSWLLERWAREHPQFLVIEGHHDDGPFNRSAAVNRAAIECTLDWDVAVIADADSFVGVDQLEAAVDVADMTGQITFAYDRFVYVNRQMTEAILDGFNGSWWDGVEWTMTGTCSSMVVVPRRLWDDVGGMDEGFVGWGGEDVGLSLACQALGGGLQRIPGEVWHLFHETAATANRDWVERIELYKQCDYDADKMRTLLAELRAVKKPTPRKKAAPK